MSIGSWLALSDYSSKYKVSVSTLRRRIKAEDINFRLADGKYFIVDEPMSTHQNHRPSLTSDTLVGTHSPNSMEDILASYAQPPPKEVPVKSEITKKHEEQILSTAHKLLTELKRAYTQILQEKEEQILLLKEEISDLKTLVKVLESENQKVKKSAK